MKALDKLYEKTLASNKVFLMNHLFNMKMSKGGAIFDHLNEFNTVNNPLSSVGVNFDDEVRALLIVCSLPKRWNGLLQVTLSLVQILLNLMMLLVLFLERKCEEKEQVRHQVMC